MPMTAGNSGSIITAVTAVYGFDFTFNAGDTSSKTVTFSFDAPGTSLDWFSSVTNLTRPAISGTLTATSGDVTSFYASGGGFTITDAYSETVGTGVAAGIFNKTITATYTTANTNTPEPATLSLLGLGLLATIGFGAGKIRK